MIAMEDSDGYEINIKGLCITVPLLIYGIYVNDLLLWFYAFRNSPSSLLNFSGSSRNSP